jgi:hypothetical protein
MRPFDGASSPILLRGGCSLDGGASFLEVVGSDDKAVVRGDVVEVDVHARVGDAACDLASRAGPVLDLEDQHVALVADDETGLLHGSAGRRRVLDEDVDLEELPRAERALDIDPASPSASPITALTPGRSSNPVTVKSLAMRTSSANRYVKDATASATRASARSATRRSDCESLP